VQVVGATKQDSAVLIEAQVADGSKCERCWRVVPDVGADGRWPMVCARCADALDAIGFSPLAGELV
jgi:isoleucyl-tRNA synthetase